MEFTEAISGLLARNDVPAACDLATKAWREGVRDPAALHVMARACFMGSNLDVAKQVLELLVDRFPENGDVCNQLGAVLATMRRETDAEPYFERAVMLGCNVARRNLAAVRLKRYGAEKDVPALRALVREHPEWVDAALQFSGLLIKQGQLREACDVLVPLVDKYPHDWRLPYQLGLALEDMRLHEQAVMGYEQARALAPQEPMPAYMLLYYRIRQCDYDKVKDLLPLVREGVERGVNGLEVMRALMADDDPAWHFKVIKLFNDRDMQGAGVAPVDRTVRVAKTEGKIRLGLLGDDYRRHPVGRCMVELLERLDKERFEVFVYNYGPYGDDDLRLRIKAAVDGWFEVGSMDDRSVAGLIASHDVDVLIDQKGVTHNARPGVYAWQPARVQLNYLGVSTMARPEFDYALADERIVPPDQACNWSEKLVYLPDCVQPQDSRQCIGEPKTRVEYGLPENGTVFVSFNQHQKMGEPLMRRWMEILRRVDGSVLWLKSFEDSLPEVLPNLRSYAAKHGVAPERIIMAGPVPSKEDHLARYKVADIALDTWPYASHTTCGDALLAGCPVVCNPGKGFVARMSLSMLHAVGMQELIVQDWDAYVELAVRLAKNPEELARVKAKLVANLPASPLFDTPRYARNFERALAMMVARADAGLPPEMMWVKEVPEAVAA